MPNGDDALAAGMDVVLGTEDIRNSYDEINKTRDYIAQRTSAVTPVLKGGTGATTASGARANLGLTTMDQAITPSTIVQRDTNASIAADYVYVGQAPVLAQHATPKSYVDAAIASKADDSNTVHRTGDTMTGQLYLPNSFAAASGFTVCYINGDGRVSRGSSSRRYKKYIHDAPALGDLFAAPLREYQMRADGVMPDDGVKHIGYIAEELVDTDMERFVVIVNDQVESIDFIALLLAQNAQLNARLSALEDKLP